MDDVRVRCRAQALEKDVGEHLPADDDQPEAFHDRAEFVEFEVLQEPGVRTEKRVTPRPLDEPCQRQGVFRLFVVCQHKWQAIGETGEYAQQEGIE
jgi:hypothetical protein